MVGGLLGKGGYPGTWDKPWKVAGTLSWASTRALSAFSSKSLVSSTAGTDPLRISLAYAKDSRASFLLGTADSLSSS